MITKKQILNIFLALCIYLPLLIYVLWSDNRRISSCEDIVNYYKYINFNGRVKNKYLNKNNHELPVIVIYKNMNSDTTIELTVDTKEYYKFYNRISLGDSVKKTIGSNIFYIFRDSSTESYTIKCKQ